MKNINNSNIGKLSITIIIFITIYFIINSSFVSLFIWKLPNLFQDWSIAIDWLRCNSIGYDIYSSSIKNCTNDLMAYGRVWMLIPYFEKFENFYYIYLPYLIILISIFCILKIINPKDNMSWLIFILCIFNPSTLLTFERANIDLLIFTLATVIVLNRAFILNWFIYIFLSFLKIYPFFLCLNFFLENKNRNPKRVIYYSLFLILISIIYLIFNFKYDFITFFGGGAVAGKAGYQFLWSLNSLAKILKYSLEFNYIFSLLITLVIYIFLIKVLLKKMNERIYVLKENFFENVNLRIFLVGSLMSLFCYIFFSNWSYREIFIILSIPYLYSLSLKLFNQKNLNLITILIVSRYVFIFLYSYFNVILTPESVNGERVFSNYLIFANLIKSLIDMTLMSLITSILIIKIRDLFRIIKLQLKMNY